MECLLARLDAAPKPVLSGADVSARAAGSLTPLLDSRLLIEVAPLDELGSCDCAVDGCYRTIARDGETVWAYCASGLAAPRRMDPEELRQFRVEVSVFHRRLRAANGLGGEEITPYSSTLCLVGRMEIGEQELPVVLARCLRPRSAENVLYEVQGRLTERPVLILTPTPPRLALDVVQRFGAAGLVLASIADLLVAASGLALDRQKIASLLQPTRAMAGSAVALRLDVERSLCHFRGAEVPLGKMQFAALVLLAREAQDGPGWVPRDRIAEVCWQEYQEKGLPPSEDQINTVVSEVRRALRGAGNLSAAESRRLLESRSKVGYRLKLRTEEIEVR